MKENYPTLKETQLIQAIEESNLNYQTAELRGSAYIKSDQMSLSGSYIARVKKNEIGWLSVRKFGIEVARALLRNDTITIINRFEKSYFQLIDKQIRDLIDIDLNTNQLIDLLIGNALIEDSAILSFTNDSTKYELKAAYNDVIATHYYDQYLEAVTKSEYSDQSLRSAIIEFSDFKIENNLQFPATRNFNLMLPDIGKANIKVTLSQIKVDEEITFPFEIPSHYRRIK